NGHDENADAGEMKAALDVARVAIRAGATEVHMVSLESFDEMPVMRTTQGREEFEEAEREGVTFHPQRSAKRFIDGDGRVSAPEFIGVQRTYDAYGRFDPQFNTQRNENHDADAV